MPGEETPRIAPDCRRERESTRLAKRLRHAVGRAIAGYAAARGFPIIPCNLRGSQENLQRKQVRRMLDVWEREHPGRSESVFRALRNVAPSQLADPKLFDFAALGSRRETVRLDTHVWLSGEAAAAGG